MNNQDKELAEWLKNRLAKCLPIDNWHREELERLLKKLELSSRFLDSI